MKLPPCSPVNLLGCIEKTPSGQIIATSHDLGPQKVAFCKGNALISGKSRLVMLVKYFNLGRHHGKLDVATTHKEKKHDEHKKPGSTRESSRGRETFRDYFYEGFLYIKVVVGTETFRDYFY